jgi:signal transduction histidine kinase/ActR/RegA family two-component response regulator
VKPDDPALRVLLLTPTGRDALVASGILGEAGIAAHVCAELGDLCVELERGAGAAIVVEDVLGDSDLAQIAKLIDGQPAWSDFPFVILAVRGGSLERNPAAARISGVLGNVTFVERPFHPPTLLSAARTALSGRRRQYEARERMEEIRRAEALLEDRVRERTSELESANRQLAAQIQERERMELALRQSQRLEAVGQLTAGVAHDFNNLLMVVLGTVHALRKTITDQEAVRRLGMMAEAAQRGAKLTAQLLAFARRQKLEPKPVDLNETVSSMRDMLQSTMGGATRIEIKLAQQLWPAMIDPTQIELVILNLAINARDAMDVGGAVTIETANVTLGPPQRPDEPAAGDYVMVSVTDTGSGMTADVLARAIEPFFTTKGVGKGSGLGLSQVFGLAKQSGGGVRIDTKLGEGTSVKVHLPRAAAEPVRIGATAIVAPSYQTQDCVVLLVDDDHAVREVTAGMLKDLGYTVLEAGSGGAAFEMLDGAHVDLALLDFAMPGMNGAEVAKEIRIRRPNIPILIATGYADAAIRTDLMEDQILQKPFDGQELALKLAAALHRAPDEDNVVSFASRRDG